MGLLEGYNLRPVLMRLLNAGYQVKVVGHSLGAGIAALIAAELRISLISKHLEVYENPDSVRSSSRGSFSMEQNLSHMDAPTTSSSTTAPPATPINTKAGTTITLTHTYIHTTTTIPTPITITTTTSIHTPTIPTAGTTIAAPSSPFPTTTTTRPTSGLRVPSYLPSTVSKISAIIFSSPAFCTINLAEAFQHDRILINTVYDKDIIPRFSFKTIELMAEELKDPNFCAQADLWTQEDKADFSAYAVSMGKAADINRTSSTATATSNAETSNTAVHTAPTTTDAILTEVGAVPVQDTDTTTGGPDTFIGKPPIKPVKPPKVDRASSVESFASYCTAEGEDSPLTPAQSRKIHEPIGITAEGVGSSISNSSSNDAQSKLDAGKPSATTTGATTTTTTGTTPATTTTAATVGSGSTKLSSFMQSVSTWQSLASTAIETLQNVNNNMGGK